MNNPLFRFLLVSLFAGLQALRLAALPEAGRFLHAADFDVAQMIPAAPADDSIATAADLEVVYQVQRRRSPEEIAVANYFVHDSVFQFDAVIGSWFTAENLPATAAFFAQIEADRRAISDQGKKLWSRPRPPLLDPRVHTCIELPKSGAYPSGHSTMAFVRAGLLAEIFPEQREALRERAQLVAWSRVVGGVHYPSDIVAGRMLGDRLVEEFLKVPAVREALEQVRAEVAAVAAQKGGRK